MPYFILVALLVVIDQVVKVLTRANIALGEHLEFIPGFDLTYIQNTGAAFSILSQHTWILTALSGVVSLILAVMLAKNFYPETIAKFSLALLLGGAIGNFIDRIFNDGRVIDMFYIKLIDFPIFNVADLFVTMPGALFCLLLIREIIEEEKQKKAAAEETHEDHDSGEC
jgi:signal peptidase II